jgi:hypothetical protein
MNPCRLSVALNVVAFVAVSAGFVAGPPIGWQLVAVGFLTWALARAQLKKY